MLKSHFQQLTTQVVKYNHFFLNQSSKKMHYFFCVTKEAPSTFIRFVTNGCPLSLFSQTITILNFCGKGDTTFFPICSMSCILCIYPRSSSLPHFYNSGFLICANNLVHAYDLRCASSSIVCTYILKTEIYR